MPFLPSPPRASATRWKSQRQRSSYPAETLEAIHPVILGNRCAEPCASALRCFQGLTC